MNELSFEFWERVKTELKKIGKTQIELCSYCDFSLNSFRVKVSQNNAPNIFDACKIADFLKVPVEYLAYEMIPKKENSNLLELSKLMDKIKRIESICKE